MNDRAIELFKQAGTKAYELCKKRGYEVGAIDTIWVSIMAGTLAESVVKECIAEFNKYSTVDFATLKVKEHFGIADDYLNIVAGAEIHSDKGYHEASLEEYNERMKDHPRYKQFGVKE